MAKHILSCSFGKDSIATALLALQHGEPLDELVYCEVMFSEEISGELPEHNRFILMQMMTRLRRFADVGSRISTCFLRIGVHAERFTPQNKRKEAFSMICPLYSFQCFISLFAI